MARTPLAVETVRAAFQARLLAGASTALRAALPKRKSGGSRSISFARVELARRETEAMRLADAYRRATPLHLVLLWAWCHEQTYGVTPAMTSKDWSLATLAAGAIVQREFDGKPDAAVPMLRWTWGEEARSTKWRKENARPVNPLGWRLQFSARQVVRWRANGGRL